MTPPGADRDAAPSDARRPQEVGAERLAQWLRPLASPVRLRLLRFLTAPHYLEEIASHLHLSRQAARKHVDQLVAIGALERRAGTRDTGPVTEYLVDPQALFLLQDEFEKLGSLRPQERADLLRRTVAAADRRVAPGPAAGPGLAVVRGLNVGLRHPLAARPGRAWTIGRDERCDVVVAYDPYASNRHAEVRWERGRFLLADLRSTNGTLHNWTFLPRGAEVELRHGDLVGVGRTLFLFWDAPAPARHGPD